MGIAGGGGGGGGAGGSSLICTAGGIIWNVRLGMMVTSGSSLSPIVYSVKYLK